MPTRVLIAEDEESIVASLEFLMRNAGFETRTARDGDTANGWIEVALSERDGGVRVDVRDNGRGISPEDHEAVFSKFHQVGDTLTDKPHGSGLGLHISRQIVEHFGGRMWVESTLGRGARFSFTLPTGAAT